MAETSRKARIALVGHCGPDSYALRSVVGSVAPGAAIVFVNDEAGAVEAAASADLLLVNRVLDGAFSEGDGIGLIAKLAAAGSAKVMLISNHPEAQAEAERAGAVAGFGKAKMSATESRQRIREALVKK